MADIPNCPRGREEEYLSDIAGLTDSAPNTPWSRKEAYLAAIDGKMDNMEAQIAALATDISFKGSVATESDLPATAAVGDAYITEDTGIIYVYVGDTGSEPWVALGGSSGGGNGIFYFDAGQSATIFDQENPFSIYKDSQLTQVATSRDIYDAVNSKGKATLIGMFNPGTYDYVPWISHLICYTNDDSMGAGTQEAICVIDGEKVGFLTYTSNTQKWSFYSTKDIGAPTVVQTTGDSTTDVMSQNAVTSMVYADPTSLQQPRLGYGANASGSWAVAIGRFATASGGASVAIGGASSNGSSNKATASGDRSTAIGIGAHSTSNFSLAAGAYSTAGGGTGSVALGPYSSTSASGEVNIGSTNTTYGYNSSNYRLLSGLYDPQAAHDAATKGYVDGLVGNIESALNTINNGGNA